jgi:hypothetical protein
MRDRSVLPRSVHRLKDHEERELIRRVQQALQAAQFLDMLGEEPAVLRFRAVDRPDLRRPFLEFETLCLLDTALAENVSHPLVHGSV